MQSMSDFTGLYPVTKTLRFELKPVGNTLEQIEKHDILALDEERSKRYEVVKESLDAYHRDFIDRTLSVFSLNTNDLQQYEKFYAANLQQAKTQTNANQLKSVKNELRKQIAKAFKDAKGFNNLFNKELLKKDLQAWITANNLTIDPGKDFFDFTTYFDNYHTNRKNLYVSDEESTSIAYRLINDNLPKFLDNIKNFEKIKLTVVADKSANILKEMAQNKVASSIEEMFELHYFNKVLAQHQIDFYNAVIGGFTRADGAKIQGINELINLYNQQQTNKSNRLPRLKQLYKQMLSEGKSFSAIAKPFADTKAMFEAITDYYENQLIRFEMEGQPQNILEKLRNLMQSIKVYDLSSIYIRNDAQLSAISQKCFGNSSLITTALNHYYIKTEYPNYEVEYEQAKETRRNKLEKEKEAFAKSAYLPIQTIQSAVDAYVNQVCDESDRRKYKKNCIADYFAQNFLTPRVFEQKTVNDLAAFIAEQYKKIESTLKNDYPADKKIQQDTSFVFALKLFLDSIMELLHIVKPLYIAEDAAITKDILFHAEFDALYEQLKVLPKLYDNVRNFVTQKPYSIEKFQLNFENKGNLLGGWVDSKTENSDNGTQYGGYLFRKKNAIDDWDYYLGISSDVKLFRESVKKEENDMSGYQRLSYYQLKTQSVYGSSYKGDETYDKAKMEFNSIIEDIVNNSGYQACIEAVRGYKNLEEPAKNTPSGFLNAIKKADEKGYRHVIEHKDFDAMNTKIIADLKKTLCTIKRIPKAKELSVKDYELFTEVISDIEELSKAKYRSYFSVSDKEMKEATTRELKPLFLFKITNKDLSFAESKANGKRERIGRKNLHTLYFEAMMDEKQTVYDLGSGNVFFRKKSIEYDNECLKNGHHKDLLINRFNYPIIKNKRFAYDKFLFHLSGTFNYTSEKSWDMNAKVFDYLKNNPDVNIIGIDRGERNLIYLTVIDQKGNILKNSDGNYMQYSLNEIIGHYKGKADVTVQISTDYQKLLEKREDDRDKARKTWSNIETIKELKEGYISQVVHVLAKLMVQYNAIVIMEDLNFGFKRGRFKVERQVYQKLEKMLIDKLNYLVFKEYADEQPGGLYNAYQLTQKFDSFKKLGKQCGFLFYVPAWNTSKIDPATGFVNLLHPKYENIEQAKSFFNCFDSICYNKDKDYFEFSFDCAKFPDITKGGQTAWKVCTFGKERYVWNTSLNNNKGDTEKWDVTQRIKQLLNEQNIGFTSGNDIKQDITSSNEKALLAGLIKFLSVTLAMRYSSNKDERDFILSPVADKNGEFFCTEKAPSNMPQDADANGAYHIAKKGLMLLKQINDAQQYKGLKFDVKNEQWLDFAQTGNFGV